MTESNGGQEETVPREQVETALRFLEGSHGDALRRPWSDEAHAYYNAIDILEAALDEELRPPDEVSCSEHEKENIQRSRVAREEGYAAATLLHERYGSEETAHNGLISRLRRIVG